MVINERDIEVLSDLRAAVDNYLQSGAGNWVRPLDCGGRNGSDHSYRLSKLAKMGLAETRIRRSGQRGSKIYTITEKGRSSLRCLNPGSD